MNRRWAALVARRGTFDDGVGLALEPRGARLHQRYICSEAHAVYVAPRRVVIESNEDHAEGLEVWNAKRLVLDVSARRIAVIMGAMLLRHSN